MLAEALRAFCDEYIKLAAPMDIAPSKTPATAAPTPAPAAKLPPMKAAKPPTLQIPKPPGNAIPQK